MSLMVFFVRNTQTVVPSKKGTQSSMGLFSGPLLARVSILVLKMKNLDSHLRGNDM